MMLWVARDEDTCLAVFYGEPRLKFGIWVAQSDRPFDFLSIDSSKYPDLKPGECRELRMVESVDEARERWIEPVDSEAALKVLSAISARARDERGET